MNKNTTADLCTVADRLNYLLDMVNMDSLLIFAQYGLHIFPWLDGASEPTEEEAVKLLNVIKEEGASCSIEWLLKGEGTQPVRTIKPRTRYKEGDYYMPVDTRHFTAGKRLRYLRRFVGFKPEVFTRDGISKEQLNAWESDREEINVGQIVQAFERRGFILHDEWILEGTGIPPSLPKPYDYHLGVTMNVLSSTVGQRIRFLRKALGCTQPEFCIHYNIPSYQLKAWERERHKLNHEEMHLLMNVLNRVGIACSEEWIKDGSGIGPRHTWKKDNQ